MNNKAVLGVGTAIVAAALLAGCSGGSEMSGMNMGGGTGGSSTSGHNAADVTFAQDMIAHHRQGQDMAKLATQRASNAKVKQLANEIAQEQDPQIQTMTGWLSQWGATAMSGMSGMAGMQGMMSDTDMQKLRQATGSGFDKLFVQLMTSHHQGGVDMAKTEVADGASPDAKALAHSIIDGETTEITEMQQLMTSP